MALDSPFIPFRFEVVLDLDKPTAGLSSPLCEAAFSECDGLELTMQTKTLEVGGVNDHQIHLIGPVTNSQLTLKRGMTSNLQLWQWFSAGHQARIRAHRARRDHPVGGRRHAGHPVQPDRVPAGPDARAEPQRQG